MTFQGAVQAAIRSATSATRWDEGEVVRCISGAVASRLSVTAAVGKEKGDYLVSGPPFSSAHIWTNSSKSSR